MKKDSFAQHVAMPFVFSLSRDQGCLCIPGKLAIELFQYCLHSWHEMSANCKSNMPTFLDFFAGSGLVTEGMKGSFVPAWANDICPKKAAVYVANHGASHFQLGSIENVSGKELPRVDLAWASFPCQDVSLAGPQDGLTGRRSGLVWEWLRVIGEMPQKPSVLVAENVVGLVASQNGFHYRRLHSSLLEAGYSSGAVVIDASHWVPQSRPRVFVISTPIQFVPSSLSASSPTWAHPRAIRNAAAGLSNWIWWLLPKPPLYRRHLAELLQFDAPHDAEEASKRNISLIASHHQARLLQELANGFKVAPGYKRTRSGKQVLELRFDGLAGCLRTPEGGSSRQLLLLNNDGHLVTRLLTVRETARLMGVRNTYKIPGSYNDGYRAMGDAVAVPTVRYLAKHLLLPLVLALKGEKAV